MSASEYRFGPAGCFVLQARQRRLLERGAPLTLGARAFDLLLALIEQRHRVLGRDELFDRVWPGRVVADDNLKMQVLALRKLLGAEAVVTVPRQGYRFGFEVQTEAPPAPAVAPAAPPLLGRSAELAQVLERLQHERLVTIAGPGGIGKTRLAQAVLAASAGAGADGVLQLDLAALEDGDTLPAALARALQLPPAAAAATPQALAHSLRSLPLLVLLDNAEHLLAPLRTLVQALLDAAPGVRLLATSQEPLGLSAETVLRLAPLPLPPPGAGVAELAANPAVALFVQRVRRGDAGFVFDEAQAEAVAEICRRLDGVPLALELAAARVPLLGAAGVLQHLERPLQLLAAGGADRPPRQRTMRDALQWSHALLPAPEQAVFRRLGVFVGSFDAETAHAVAGAPDGEAWDTLERLGQLAERSLLQVLPEGGHMRYRLLESARAFALEQLAAAGETATTQRRLAEAMLARFDAAGERLAQTQLLRWTESLQPELGHLRTALTWAFGPQGDAALALALAAVSGAWFGAAGLDAEGARWVRAAQALLGPDTPPRREAQLWHALANLGTQPSIGAATAHEAAQRAATLWRGLGDGPALYRTLSLLAQHGQRLSETIVDVPAVIEEMATLERATWSALQRRARRWLQTGRLSRAGQWLAAVERHRTEVVLMQEAGDEWRAWDAAQNGALAEIMLGRPQEGAALLAPAVAAIEQRGLGRRCWSQLAILAMCRIEAGDPAAAAPAVRDAVAVMRVVGMLSWLDDHFAWWLALRGQPAAAARLHGWAETAHAVWNGQRSPQGRLAHERLVGWLGTRLAPAERSALVDEGRRLSDDEVAVLLLG